MKEKLAIIFALVCAFHGVVDGRKTRVQDQDRAMPANPPDAPGNGNGKEQDCIVGWYWKFGNSQNMEIWKYCALTGKLHKN